ncbi:MAG: sugar phosphorylase [Planctomycetes bacterium]|nr:sugar phosphorylase [Planctomycetota bacterium]
MIKFMRSELIKRFHNHFELLYGKEADHCMHRLRMLFGRYGVGENPVYKKALWSEKDISLITYADMVRQEGAAPLTALKSFVDTRLKRAINTIHILPFFPYSSDDGFSIIDYREVNPDHGNWSNLQALGENFNLMFDLVLNHISRQSKIFKDFINGIGPGRHFFIEIDPDRDLTSVVRPRNSPLANPVQTRAGEKHLWNTFGPDQIDLNFPNPDVLFEFLDIMLYYIYMGARALRLDAIAYIWKKVGTSCIHLPETHEIVKLFRDVLGVIAPDVLLLTETNVPHEENISYFGKGDEANLVYQFSLPPLLLHALTTGNAQYLTTWADSLDNPPAGCTFFNFTASHDGIGVRPLEGLIPQKECQSLFARMVALGGQISTKQNSDGSESPYEINISYFDALGDNSEDNTEVTEAQINRFLCSQTIPLALKGIPAIYFHSLTATRNWYEGLEQTGRARTLNRRKWDKNSLAALLDKEGSPANQVFTEYVRRIRIRRQHPAFHPDAPQEVLELGKEFFAVRRTSLHKNEIIVAISNITNKPVDITVNDSILPDDQNGLWRDLLRKGAKVNPGATLKFKPYETRWLCLGEEVTKTKIVRRSKGLAKN